MQMKGLGAGQENREKEGKRKVMGTSGRGVKGQPEKSSSNKTTNRPNIYNIIYV